MKALSMAVVSLVLLVAAVFVAHDSNDGLADSVICLVAVLVSMPYHDRRIEKMRRGREILNRYGPERNSRPLGL